MDEFVHPPKRSFKLGATPKLDQINKPLAASNGSVNNDKPDLTATTPTNNESSSAFKITAPVNNPVPPKLDMQLTEAPPDYHIKPKSRRLSKKKLLVICGVVLVLAAAGFAAYWFFIKDSNEQPSVTVKNNSVKATPTPTPKPVSSLTGVTLDTAELAARPVTGMMIENSYAARPQSGLLEAGIVFEAIAEGGITRFLALYQEAQPQYIGPVRSIRPYYVDFALAFNAAVGHVGGSPDALSDIRNLGMRDLDQFANAGSYWRINERDAPHNVYTSFEKIDALNKAKGYTGSTFTPLPRKKDVPQTPTAAFIDLSISSPGYSPRYQYEASTNSYKRFMDGAAHTDQKSGTQINPKVVVALVMQKSLMSDGSHTVYQDIGSNKMFVFQDGIVSEGTWAKADRSSQFTFTDSNGLPLLLNAGQMWVSIVDSESDVSYKI